MVINKRIMFTRKPLLFLSLKIAYFVGLTIPQPDPFLDYVCENNGNYTASSTYRRNLDTVLSSLPSTNTGYGFYNFSSGGEDPDAVNGIALCRGDVELGICVSCVNDSIVRLRQLCPNQKDAIGWYDYCMLRYSNAPILNTMDTRPDANVTTVATGNPTAFNSVPQELMARLRDKAAAGDSVLKFSTGNMTVTDSTTIYGLMQCTPDLSKQQCYNCLENASKDLPNDGIGRRIFLPSCNLRFDIRHFYNDRPLAPRPSSLLAPPPSSPPGNDNKSNQTAIIIVVPTVIIVILLASSCIFLIKRRKQRKPKEKFDPDDAEIGNDESLQYDFSTIRVATNNFSNKNKLGQGGFGSVYKGTLQSGEEIAVKRLAKDSGQGELEFKNEVLLVARLQHRNLVKLRGFCFERTERLLIYEFMHNASLDHFLFDPTKRANLDWDTRSKIINGIARGVLYLHEDSRLRIIHRDLKASNVLLDEEMTPKIADFGMAKLVVRNETQGDTNRIVGTYGYMAPEYAMHGQFSVQSDVFSFGVLVLEIVSGRKNLYFKNGDFVEDLLSSAWKSFRDGTAIDMIDPILWEGQSSIHHILRSIHIGLLCVQENITSRPTMASVVLMLSSSSPTLPAPLEPPFFMHNISDVEEPLRLGGYSFATTNSRQSKSIPTSSGLSTNDISGSSYISNKVI